MSAETEQEQVTTEEVVAEETTSPVVTEGASTSDAAETEPKDEAEEIRDEFLLKYGEEEEAPADTDAEAEEPDPEAKKAAEGDGTERKEENAEEEFRISEEDYSKLPKNLKGRLGFLSARASKAEKRADTAEAEVTTFKDRADRFDVIQTYATDNNLVSEDISMSLGGAAHFKSGRYQDFLDYIKPFYDTALQATGQAYPEDLQQQVDDGHITEDGAREISKSRITERTATEKAKQAQTTLEQNTDNRAASDSRNSILTAVAQREAELRANDPLYAQFENAVKEELSAFVKMGANFNTPEEAVNLVNKAYEYAKPKTQTQKTLKPTIPRPSTTVKSAAPTSDFKTDDQMIDYAAESYVPPQ